MKSSLNIKINVLIVSVIIIYFTLIGVFDYNKKKSLLLDKLNIELNSVSNRLSKTLAPPLWSINNQLTEKLIYGEMQNKSISNIVVFDAQSKKISASVTRGLTWRPVDLNGEIKKAVLEVRRDIEYQGIVIGELLVQMTDRFAKKEIQNAAKKQARKVLILIVLLIILLSSTMFFIVLSPIRKLSKAFRSISDGESEDQLKIRRNDELGELASSFIFMKKAIGDKINALDKEIEEKKEFELKLKASEGKYRNLFELSRDAILLLDPQKSYIDCNSAALKLFGIENKEELLKMTPSELSPTRQPNGEDSAVMAREAMAKALKDGSNYFEWQHVKISGEKFPSTVLATKIELGDKVVLQGTIRDISKQKESEDRLRSVHKYLSDIINSMPSAIIVVDNNINVTQWNKKAEELTGIPFDAALGKPLKDVFPRMSSEIQNISESISTGKTKQGQSEYQDIIGTHFESRAIYPISTNGARSAVIRIDDVTCKIQVEEIMMQSEKMMSVGCLAAGMAHEINNPLAGMIQTAMVMKKRLSDHDMKANMKAAERSNVNLESISSYMEERQIFEMLDSIKKSGDRAAKIISNMLSFARKDTSKTDICDIPDLIDQCIELSRVDYDISSDFDFKQIEISKAYDKDIPKVECEEGKIKQVIMNLLRNSFEAIHRKRLTNQKENIEIENPLIVIRIATSETKDSVSIEILDNGTGISDETKKRIFEPFFTTKPVDEGAGLGLSVAYFIVTDNHGGKLHVDTTFGQGTKIKIKLPVEFSPIARSKNKSTYANN